MTKVTFTTESTFNVTRRNGASVEINVEALSAEMVANLFAYGLRQKVNDSASGAKDKAESESMMQACVENLLAGTWAMRSAAAESDPLEKFRIAIVREILAKPQNSKLKESYDAIDSSDQKTRREFLLSIASKNADAIDPVAQARLGRGFRQNAHQGGETGCKAQRQPLRRRHTPG